MARRLWLGVLTPKALTSREEARLVLDLLCGIYPILTPERYGNTEPLRMVFDPSNPEEFLDAISWSVFWKRKRPRVGGGIFPADGRVKEHGWITISIDAARVDVEELVRFVQVASSSLNADFAHLHMVTAGDVPIGGTTETVARGPGKNAHYYLGVTTHHLRKYLPDLYWATVFGPAYIEHFGRDRILSAPAPIVRELDGGLIYLQLSESPFDLETDFAEVDAVRQNIKRHLDNNSFFDLHLPADHVYNVPTFHLESKGDMEELNVPPPIWQVQDAARASAPLDESERQLLKQVVEAAEAAISHAKEYHSVDLDYSPDTVRKVEEILAALLQGSTKLSDDEINNAATMYGGYIGEVMRRKWGGKWYWECNIAPGARVLALQIGYNKLFPVNKVQKRLIQGSGDDVWFYYQVFDAKLSEAH